MKRILMATCFALATSMTYAQEIEPAAEPNMPKEKKFDHRIGAQMNGLIRQVFNFSNANNPVNNPYLLTYSINFRKSGWGLRIGGGYNKQFVASNDGITETETDINNWQARFGVEKRFRLSDKWTAGAGIDGVYGDDNNNTNTITRAFDTSIVKSKTSVSTMGAGAMAWLQYHVTEKVLIGTEMSYYQRYGTQKINLSITERSTGFPGNGTLTTTVSKKEHDLAEGVISLPVVLYLIVQF